MTQEGNKLTPAEGKWLTDGQTWSGLVYLGTLDTADRWREATEEEYQQAMAEAEAAQAEPAESETTPAE